MRVIADQTAAIAECSDELVGRACGLDIIKYLFPKARYEHIEYRCAVSVGPDYGVEEIAAFETS